MGRNIAMGVFWKLTTTRNQIPRSSRQKQVFLPKRERRKIVFYSHIRSLKSHANWTKWRKPYVVCWNLLSILWSISSSLSAQFLAVACVALRTDFVEKKNIEKLSFCPICVRSFIWAMRHTNSMNHTNMIAIMRFNARDLLFHISRMLIASLEDHSLLHSYILCWFVTILEVSTTIGSSYGPLKNVWLFPFFPLWLFCHRSGTNFLFWQEEL